MRATIFDFVARLILIGAAGFGGSLACRDPMEPYYLYNGNPVYLRTNPTRITIQADSAALPKLTAVAGVAVDSVRSWFAAPRHWIVWLRVGTSTNAAISAARRLRLAPSVQFASNAYDYLGASAPCTVMLVNRLGIDFKAGTTDSQIANVLQRYGLEGSRDPYDTVNLVWIVRYPVASPYTPLELSAIVYRDPYVAWAEADRVDCGGPPNNE